ncbi:MAG TPA: UvrD-helicase domain-containing protein [Acidobacteriaceae bacterium]|jgi:ATP-dependent exoDNAse (exonuclease V) beta subunit|nr:UvrD-helicase domain-containing protein [Acidobacteriaceae bacterium]
MPDILVDAPADQAAREHALDIRRSVLVQAPAGSGKTELLTRRFLRLLAVVDEPEEILAITFTRAATAEMRNRILSDLEAVAARGPVGPVEIERLGPAQEAWTHAERRGWDLLRQPQRLLIETIDSLCLRIAYDRPLLAGLGGRLQPVDDATLLYHEAARRTLDRLGTTDPALDAGLAHLLDLRDNRLQDSENLLAGMLERRDQWLHAFPLTRRMTEDDWGQLRSHLEEPFQREIRRVVGEVHRILAAQPASADQLLELATYAASQGNEKVALLAGVSAFLPDTPPDHWRCLCDFLLNGKHEWLTRVDKRHGFPSGTREQKDRKQAMERLLAWLQHRPDLLAALRALRKLPPDRYSQEQWTTLRHLFTVLRQAIAELRVVFAERNAVDFTEVSLAAIEVLEHVPDRLLAIGGNLRHLLVDEFQDTSRIQHHLVKLLLSAWDSDPDGHRSAFLVGDPMQSIYMFRQAEVELFAHVRDHGIGAEPNCFRCERVQLSVNFRSHAGLTDPLNAMFTRICAGEPLPGSAAVGFAPATARDAAPCEPALHVHPQILGTPDRHPAPDETRAAQQHEAHEVLRILEQALPAIEAARSEGREYRVAVLVRARPHLAQLVPLLRRRGIPFRAVEIERLSERQELLDLLSLTRALLHPMDRIAWLAVLRAPWCGLSLDDLHRLTGADSPAFKRRSIPELIDLHQNLLSPDGHRRLTRTADILRRALQLRWRQADVPSFASWIERTWRTLGGPACVDAASYENVQAFFTLLDALPPDGLAPFTGEFAAELDRLFARPDPSVSDTCGIQLMTIHKAKGLGFDVVIVPGLERTASGDDNSLVCSLERIDPWRPGETEFLVAPIGLHGEDTEPLYRWVRRQRQIRFNEERKRLFYVACTRARRELHLLGAAVYGASGLQPPGKDSLLATAWPALQEEFEAATRAPQPASAPARVLAFPTPGVIGELAAGADSGSATGPRRLLLDIEPLPVTTNVAVAVTSPAGSSETPQFARPEGSRQARLIGSTVHTMLQRLGPGLANRAPADLRARAAGLLRAAALTGDGLPSATAAVTKMLRACADDPVCRWILAAHPDAQSEVSWSVYLDEESGTRLRTLRADRVFRAGPSPLAEGEDVFWIIDYKTSPGPSGALFLAQERSRYAPQLEAYARILRAMHGQEIVLRSGLYYPALSVLDYWDPAAD